MTAVTTGMIDQRKRLRAALTLECSYARATHSASHYGSSNYSPASETFHLRDHDLLSVSLPSDKAKSYPAAEGQLSDKSKAILGSLYSHRLMTTDQIKRLHWETGVPSTRLRRTQACLRRLVNQGLITNCDRQIGLTRRAKVFRLSGHGMAVLGLAEPSGKRRKYRPGKRYHQDHTLACTETYVRLVEVCRTNVAELLDYAPEPSCWRLFVGPGGGSLELRPDGYARIATADYRLSSFIEVDLGSESLPTISRKCQQYVKYFHTGEEQRTRETFPQVVWLVRDRQRLNNIRSVVSGLPADVQSLFRVALAASAPTALTTPPEADEAAS